MPLPLSNDDRVVITGIGVVTSIGSGREAVWQAMQRGACGVRRLTGLPGIPDGMLLAATVDVEGEFPGQLKNIPLCRQTAAEALRRCAHPFWLDRSRAIRLLDRRPYGRHRFRHRATRPRPRRTFLQRQAAMVGAVVPEHGLRDGGQRLRSARPADEQLHGLRERHDRDLESGPASIRDGQCDLALAGSSEAIHPLFAAGFHNMGVLADHADPTQACRPFDVNRARFRNGRRARRCSCWSGSATLADRRAAIYAEVLGGRILTDARHVTSLSDDSDALEELIRGALWTSRVVPRDIALRQRPWHGHAAERRAGDPRNSIGIWPGGRFGVRQRHRSRCLGHLVNASGSVELAISALALRDGFAPPTLNLTDPDPECDLDCVPLVGRARPLEHALKLSIAFGGHLAAVVLRRWTAADARQALPLLRQAA